jgi:hypothetical protein
VHHIAKAPYRRWVLGGDGGTDYSLESHRRANPKPAVSYWHDPKTGSSPSIINGTPHDTANQTKTPHDYGSQQATVGISAKVFALFHHRLWSSFFPGLT